MGVASSWGGVRPKRYNGQPEIAPEKENRRKTPLAFTRREQPTKQKINHQRKQAKNKKPPNFLGGFLWSRRRDSNPRPADYKSAALAD